MQIKQIFASLLLLGAIPVASIGLTACSDRTPIAQQPNTEAQSDTQSTPIQHGSGMPAHESMDLGPKDADFDLRFIDAMILHHQGAVAMAEAAQQNSERDEIKQLADAIIAAQQTEIDQMQQWRQEWYPDAGAEPVMYHAEAGHMMPMTSDMQAAMMMNVDLGEADEEFDLRFIDAMIPHHEGALDMAQQVLENSDRPELQELAQNILASQQQEIDQMQRWRQEWYGQG